MVALGSEMMYRRDDYAQVVNMRKHLLALLLIVIGGLLASSPCCGQVESGFAKAGDKLGDFTVYFQPGQTGYIDTKGKVVVEMKFDDFRSYSNGRAAIYRVWVDPLKPKKARRSYGFVGRSGGVAVRASYAYVNDFSEGLAAVNRSGLRSNKGGWSSRLPGILSLVADDGRWDSAPLGRDGYMVSSPPGRGGLMGGQWGYVDKNGKIVIPPSFSYARNFHEGLAFVKGDLRDHGGQLKNASGYIDRAGQWAIVSKDKRFGGDFSEGLAEFYDKFGKYGYIDKRGNVAIPARFYTAGKFRNGRAKFWIEDERTGTFGKCGFIDKSGTIVVPAKYAVAGDYNEGLAPVRGNRSKWGYIGLDGRLVIPHQYEDALEFSSDLAAVKSGGRWGYIDKKGKTIIAPRYVAASHFRGQLARVNVGGISIDDRRVHGAKGGAWKFIDKSGKFISDLEFDDARDFREGRAAFRIVGKYGLKDRRGDTVLPAQFDRIGHQFCDGRAKVLSRGRWGFISNGGKLIIPPTFKSVRDFHEGFAAVKVGDKWGYVDKNGHLKVKP